MCVWVCARMHTCVCVCYCSLKIKIFPEPLLPGALTQQPCPAKGVETKVVKLSAEDNPIILDEVSTVQGGQLPRLLGLAGET